MTRPLQGLIETMREYEGGPDPMIYWTKGHVDKAQRAETQPEEVTACISR